MTEDELLGELTLDEKISQLAGEDMWHLPAVERVGMGRLKMSDGPIGVRGETFGTGPASMCFPCGAALGATWNTALVQELGSALGHEAQAKSAHVLLGPTVNLQRHPLGGRHFECYSEDPVLTAEVAAAYVTGVQSVGVAACVKHLVANDTEVDRFTIDAVVDDRTLREVYLLPFERALLGAGAWSTMAAYNRLNGPYCCEQPWLLNELLRHEWGWDGVVVSDWLATHSTAPALRAGLDVEMPGPPAQRGTTLQEAVGRGEVKPDDVDRAAARVLRLRARTGALRASGPLDERYEDDPARRALARRAAAEAIVLLENDDHVLPLDASRLQRIAVIGPNADVMFQPMGGGSAEVTPPYVVTPLDGLRAALAPAGVEVTHDVGCVPADEFVAVDPRAVKEPGFRVTLTDTAGATRNDVVRRPLFRWGTDLKTATASGTFVALADGDYVFELRGPGRMRLAIDGDVVVDGWERGDRPPTGAVAMSAGREYQLLADYEAPEHAAWRTGFEIRLRPPWPEDARHAAAEAAMAADAAIVVVGLSRDVDTEGRDRPDMNLPAGQDELVATIAAANPRTIVVINAGSPVAMPWRDDVAAIVQLWYPGQEGGNALADVVTGTEPGGRLPCTFPVQFEDSPGHAGYPGTEGTLRYEEGVFVGYRGYEATPTAPLFAFGHGVSYTTFEFDGLEADASGASVCVTNTGARAGSAVVQLYVGDVDASVPRPAKELKGFAKLQLEPGATEVARFAFDDRTFAFWDGEWRVEPGAFEVMVGASSADIRARATIIR